MTMPTAAVFGSTGAVGSQILNTLLGLDSITQVTTISRQPPSNKSSKLQSFLESDTSKWNTLLSSITPHPSIVFNAIGTTLAAAGSIAQQRAIDHDLCIANAQAAKAAGITTCVFISSAGIRGMFSPFAYTPYAKMKVGVEDGIKELGFDHAIILRPGMILGRERAKNALLERLFNNLDVFGKRVKDSWGQDQAVIARAAVAAARVAEKGMAPSRFWVLEAADIIKLGRDNEILQE